MAVGLNRGGGALMKYQDCIQPAQAPDGTPGGHAAGERLAEANINPATGLATDYLNHFNEAIMLLEMLPSCPDCVEDFLAWRPLSYREHFAGSRFKGRDLAIAAYDAAEPALRERLDTLTGTMTAMLEATRAALNSGLPPDAGGFIAEAAAAWLKPLIARAGALINGEADGERSQPSAPQAVVDGLFARSPA
jgi:hypothetical protein